MSIDTTGELGTVLGIWAHPDDEAWLSAGLMASAVAAGRRVVCVTATKGEAGFPDDDPRTVEERTAVRVAELDASIGLLGVSEHRWLGYADGGCASVDDDEGSAIVAALIDEIRPDTVLTFGPDGATGHPDHVAVCRWSTLALSRLPAPAPRLLYATKTGDWGEKFMSGDDPGQYMMIEGFTPESVELDELAVWFSCDDAMLALKVDAMRAQTSQIEPIFEAFGLEAFRGLVRDEFFRDVRPGDAEILAQATAFSRRSH